MYDHQLYLRTLSEFTRTLLTPYDVHAMFDQLVDRVTSVLGLAGSGVSLDRDGRLELATALGDDVTAAEQAQEQCQMGPCVTAFRSGEIVAVPDLREARSRWPEYAAVADGVGIRAVASIPMRLGDVTVGALNLYAREVRDWPREDLDAAVVLADMATVYLINASHHRKQVELTEQLQQALDSRLVIEQAKGMLAARHSISPERAFERLRSLARNRSVTVQAVAEAVVRLGLDP
jgi:GAF domain-containing protein